MLLVVVTMCILVLFLDQMLFTLSGPEPTILRRQTCVCLW